jgi:hypothetical protein
MGWLAGDFHERTPKDKLCSLLVGLTVENPQSKMSFA